MRIDKTTIDFAHQAIPHLRETRVMLAGAVARMDQARAAAEDARAGFDRGERQKSSPFEAKRERIIEGIRETIAATPVQEDYRAAGEMQRLIDVVLGDSERSGTHTPGMELLPSPLQRTQVAVESAEKYADSIRARIYGHGGENALATSIDRPADVDRAILEAIGLPLLLQIKFVVEEQRPFLRNEGTMAEILPGIVAELDPRYAGLKFSDFLNIAALRLERWDGHFERVLLAEGGTGIRAGVVRDLRRLAKIVLDAEELAREHPGAAERAVYDELYRLVDKNSPRDAQGRAEPADGATRMFAALLEASRWGARAEHAFDALEPAFHEMGLLSNPPSD